MNFRTAFTWLSTFAVFGLMPLGAHAGFQSLFVVSSNKTPDMVVQIETDDNNNLAALHVSGHRYSLAAVNAKTELKVDGVKHKILELHPRYKKQPIDPATGGALNLEYRTGIFSWEDKFLNISKDSKGAWHLYDEKGNLVRQIRILASDGGIDSLTLASIEALVDIDNRMAIQDMPDFEKYPSVNDGYDAKIVPDGGSPASPSPAGSYDTPTAIAPAT